MNNGQAQTSGRLSLQWMRRGMNSRPCGVGSVVILAFGPMLLGGCGDDVSASGRGGTKLDKRICVLGCDGMDPKLVRRMIDEGRLPNLARLEREGGFKPLETSIPPQSPVAWSNFITGAGPGVHGIFDFIHRDPKKQTSPFFSTNRIIEAEKRDPLKLGDYRIPQELVFPWVEGAQNELLRRGTPFWDYLDAAGIPVQMYKLPANYPPSESKNGHMCCLAGMGVPDALANQGTYEHFSTRPRRETKSPEGFRLRLRPHKTRGAFVGTIIGPKNELKKGEGELTVDLMVYPDPKNDVAKLIYVNEGVLGDETVELVLNAGEMSGWAEVHFLKTSVGPTFSTMVRFFLQSVRPELEIYMTPLNFLASAPAAVISEPPEFAGEICDAIGPYHTQGFAEAFNARKHKLISDEEYRIQAESVLEESERIMEYALDRFERGLLFFYYSSTDLQAHIFWWDSDEKHPARTPEDAKKYMGVVEAVYERMDKALGRCRERLGDDATIIVMSDHGFCNFKRCVGLTTWLRDEGYLAVKRGIFQDANWSKTKAYGLGLNGLYVNLKGREKYGIVDPKDKPALLDEITEKLLALTDPDTGQKVIRRVYRAEECYKGPETANAPDLLVGYERGYRASWNTCLGDCDGNVVFDNDSAWSADHCIAHDAVPGIVLSNRPILAEAPALTDLAPTLLAEFEIDRPEHMTGRCIFEPMVEKVAGK